MPFELLPKTISADLHTHLLEKKVNPIKWWYKVIELGLNAVAITEHSDMNPKKAFDLLNKIKPDNILLIPGMEVNTTAGHVLLYSEDERIYDLKSLNAKKVDFGNVLNLAQDNSLTMSFSHPFGFDYDSAGYVIGTGKLVKLLRKNDLGIECYTGMIGNLSNFLYESNWVKRPVRFFSYLEKNVVAKKTGLSRIAKKVHSKIERQTFDIVMRCFKAVELGSQAKFITAGSDAHSADRIGTGMMKMKSIEAGLSNELFLSELKKKENIVWAGPLIIETMPGIYKIVERSVKRKEALQGLKYVAKKIARPKLGIKRKVKSGMKRLLRQKK
ncbi:MAG: hypothetical protein AB1467_01470 [Candidatus Diapherotrites archaeon]